MFNPERIRSEFFGLVGLRQTDNPEFPKLSDKLLYTGSNVLIQHPLLSIENIDMCARNYSLYDYPVWDNTIFSAGDRVKHNNVVYESLVNNNQGNQPDSSTEWKEVNLLALYLEDVFENAINETVNTVFVNKKLSNQSKTLLNNVRLSDGVGNINDLIINEGDLVGVEIKLKQNQNIVAVINKIGLQLTHVNPDLNIYVYHSSQYEPIATVSLNHSKALSFQWHNTDLKLNYLSDLHDAGGVFYIMYDQSQLAGQAIMKNESFNSQPCSCNYKALQNFNLYSRYVTVTPCRVSSIDRNGVNLWDISKTKYVSNTNFGLNFEITMKCDLTEFVITQKESFSFALRDMVTVKLLQNLALSTRQNITQTKVDQMARAELQESKIGGMGLMEKLDKQLKAVDFDISDLDSTCMPCQKKSGVTFGVAGLAS